MGGTGRVPRQRVCETHLSATGTRADSHEEITVNKLKYVCLTLLQLVKQMGSQLKTLANVGPQRQQQKLQNEREAERLDRIRNPSKYRGK